MLPPEAKSTGGLARCAIHASWNTFEGSKFPLSHVDFGFRFIPSPKTTGCKHAQTIAVDNMQCGVSSRSISLTDGFGGFGYTGSLHRQAGRDGIVNNMPQTRTVLAEPGLEQEK